MDDAAQDFIRVGTLEELRAAGRLVLRGRHRPVLVLHDRGRVFALDNRCPHMGFPLHRGTVEDGVLTCHWHHARFAIASGCTFDLWADDVPTCPVELRDGAVWVKAAFGHPDPANRWRRRLEDGLGHNLGLVLAKAVQGLRRRCIGASPARRDDDASEGPEFCADVSGRREISRNARCRRPGETLCFTMSSASGYRMGSVNSPGENRPEERRRTLHPRAGGEQPGAEKPLVLRRFSRKPAVGETVTASGSWRTRRIRTLGT
jgi:nitrite reductase/ring-hydroxylating ferredoxin subunit